MSIGRGKGGSSLAVLGRAIILIPLGIGVIALAVYLAGAVRPTADRSTVQEFNGTDSELPAPQVSSASVDSLTSRLKYLATAVPLGQAGISDAVAFGKECLALCSMGALPQTEPGGEVSVYPLLSSKNASIRLQKQLKGGSLGGSEFIINGEVDTAAGSVTGYVQDGARSATIDVYINTGHTGSDKWYIMIARSRFTQRRVSMMRSTASRLC